MGTRTLETSSPRSERNKVSRKRLLTWLLIGTTLTVAKKLEARATSAADTLEKHKTIRIVPIPDPEDYTFVIPKPTFADSAKKVQEILPGFFPGAEKYPDNVRNMREVLLLAGLKTKAELEAMTAEELLKFYMANDRKALTEALKDPTVFARFAELLIIDPRGRCIWNWAALTEAYARGDITQPPKPPKPSPASPPTPKPKGPKGPEKGTSPDPWENIHKPSGMSWEEAFRRVKEANDRRVKVPEATMKAHREWQQYYDAILKTIILKKGEEPLSLEFINQFSDNPELQLKALENIDQILVGFLKEADLTPKERGAYSDLQAWIRSLMKVIKTELRRKNP